MAFSVDMYAHSVNKRTQCSCDAVQHILSKEESIMPSIIRKLHRVLTCGAIVAILAVPGNAASLGLGGLGGVSVGGNGASANAGGASGADADASFGGSSTSATASIGGTSGANGAVSLGGDQAADTAVSLGGTDTGATASIGTSGANVGIGTLGASAGVGAGIPSTSGVPVTPGTSVTTGPKPSAALAQMTGNKLMRMKKRCVDVLSSEGTYDADLRALCLMISRR
ncbi:hypothetical protein [Mesorhizobium hawassense]|uniref:hypothetical protein n=1 Tax=Mesorhizobium hawassense TaxID=1209954 RepID=UPI0011BDE706|nr:hypothetical protein [Mesorhizobium hawassense]